MTLIYSYAISKQFKPRSLKIYATPEYTNSLRYPLQGKDYPQT